MQECAQSWAKPQSATCELHSFSWSRSRKTISCCYWFDSSWREGLSKSWPWTGLDSFWKSFSWSTPGSVCRSLGIPFASEQPGLHWTSSLASSSGGGLCAAGLSCEIRCNLMSSLSLWVPSLSCDHDCWLVCGLMLSWAGCMVLQACFDTSSLAAGGIGVWWSYPSCSRLSLILDCSCTHLKWRTVCAEAC